MAPGCYEHGCSELHGAGYEKEDEVEAVVLGRALKL